MSQSSNAPLVRIPTLGPDQLPLTKQQQTFNDLTQRIDALENEIAQLRSTVTTLNQRLQTDYLPLLREYDQLRASLVRVFDRAHDRPDTSRPEQRKLVSIIRSLAYELIVHRGIESLRSIGDKYDAFTIDDDINEVSFGESTIESSAPQLDDASDRAECKEPQRPRSARKQAREAQKEAEARNITKAVRTLYTDLVKAFHPDREPDEAEKERKTSIMQRIISAYEKSDLLALLRLQLEYNHIDQRQLQRVADEQIRYYNTILKQQVAELGEELAALQTQLANLPGQPLRPTSAIEAVTAFDGHIRTLKRSVKDLKKEVRALNDPATLKAWLRSYRAGS